MKVGLVQFRPAAGRPDANRATAVEAIEAAAGDGADVVALPELFTVGFFAFDRYDGCAEAFDGPTVRRLSTAARNHGVAVLAGSFVEELALTDSVETPADAGLANTSVFIDDDGSVAAWYRKQHLFGIDSEEDDRLVPGDTLGVTPFRDLTVGITTCYDLRFPELYRAYLDAGATLLFVPSAWPDARPEHWRVLLRARAIENQWFVVAVNGVGEVAGTRLLGDSLVVDPWGDVVADLGREPVTRVVEIDVGAVEGVRRGFPVLEDRRL